MQPLVRLLFALVFLVAAGPADAASVTALPTALPPGDDLAVSGRGLTPGVRYNLTLNQVETQATAALGDAQADGAGEFDVSIPLPVISPGAWEVRVNDPLSGPQATTPIEVLGVPGIEANPSRVHAGETVTLTGFDLTPGTLAEIRVDGMRVLGPVLVVAADDNFSFLMTASAATVDEAATVTLSQSIDGQPAGEATTLITRLAATATSFGGLVFQGVPTSISFGETYSFTGSLTVPSGLNPENLDWKYALVFESNLCLPVPSAIVDMQSNGEFQVLNARLDGLIDGYSPTYLTQTFDEHGLVYRNPETGESDCIMTGGLNLSQESAVPISVLVKNPQGEPIGGARVILRQGLYQNPYAGGATTKGLSLGDNLGLGSAHLYGENQFTVAQNVVDQGLCPASETIQYTPEQGESAGLATFVINPFEYIIQKASAAAASAADINTFVPEPQPLEYSIKVAALDKGYGYVTEDGCGTGLRFDLQVRDEGFFLRNDVDGEFTVLHDPFSGPLEVTLPEFPETGNFCFPTLPYVPGLPQEEVPAEFITFNGQAIGATFSYSAIRYITSFPNTAQVPSSFFQTVAPTRVEVAYDQALFGQLEGTMLTLQGQSTPVPMSLSVNSGACSVDAGILVGEVPGLHRYPAGIYSGTIRGEIGSTGKFVEKNFKLEVREGPTWFADPGQYEDVKLYWNASKVRIVATETLQMQDASTNSPASQQALAEYEVGPMNNDQSSQGEVTQDIVAGEFGGRYRRSISIGQVNNKPTEQFGLLENLSANEDGSGTARRKGSETPQCLHADGSPFPRPDALVDFGSCERETIFTTGAIPIFRYAWGVPPIAAATLGADIWFGVFFRYFGDVKATLQAISVNFTAEPIVEAGLDIFFDLSALFGIVSARVEASPVISVSMPITVLDSTTAGLDACFNFDLILAYVASVGWCDLCVKASDDITLFTISEPNGCPFTQAPRRKGALAGAININRPAIAVSSLGTTWVAYETELGIRVEQRFGSLSIKSYDLDSQPGAMRPQIAFVNDDTGVVVWTQTDLSIDDFNLIDGQTGFENASSELHLVYAVYDAATDSFGPTQDLTPPSNGGDGAVSLAVCPPAQAACGASGRLLAAWEHDRAGNLAMHDLEVQWAEFDGLGWGPVQAIDPGNPFKQVQPEVVYHEGEPVVLWIENPMADGSAYDMNQRHLRYRFPTFAPAQDALGVPMSIASPDAISHPDGELLVAYTISADQERFIGSRRKLHTAWGDCTMGVCTWTDEERLDAQGRSLYVEQPRLAQDGSGRVTALFRYLSNSDVQESDPVGVRTGTGDVAKLELVAPTLTNPTPISNDGRMNIGLQTVINPATGNLLTVVAKTPDLDAGVLRAVGSKAATPLTRVKGVQNNPDVFIGVDSGLPDFAVLEATTEATVLPPGGEIAVTVKLMNQGGSLPGVLPELVATWDRPFGPATPVLTTSTSIGLAGAMETLNLLVPVPAGFTADEKRRLYLTVNPGAMNPDSNGENDQFQLAIGGLPTPIEVKAFSSRESSLVQIEWPPLEDERVTGYTVYRRNPDGKVLLLGTTPTHGFLDTRAVPDRIYEYQVRSHSALLTESEPTPWMEHYVQALLLPELMFSDSFENLF